MSAPFSEGHGPLLTAEPPELMAYISGGVNAPMLSIEEGVLFHGTLEMRRWGAQHETTLHPIAAQASIRRLI